MAKEKGSFKEFLSAVAPEHTDTELERMGRRGEG